MADTTGVTPEAPQSACAPESRRSYTRADILSLGRAGRPWEFLGVAARALDLAPGDAGIRLLAAMNLAALGLATLARAQVALLPAEVRADQAVAGLERSLSQASGDRVEIDELRGTLAGNMEAIAARGGAAEAPVASVADVVCAGIACRARDGNIVRAPSVGAPLSAWAGLRDGRGLAARAIASLPPAKDGFPSPLVLDGSDPWVMLEAAAARERTRTGYHPPITVVEEDPVALAWSLASADLRGVLAQDRVNLFVGPGAVERFERALLSRLDAQVSGYSVPARPTPNTSLHAAYRRVCDAQQRLTDTLGARVTAAYQRCGTAHWRARFEEAAGGGPALRILIPTTRFSTFVQHASRDLAEAARRAGHEARVMLEGNDHSRFSTAAYLREMAEFRPDLVVLVNYPRAAMHGVIPAGVPLVCWLQDSLPHLFDGRVGAAQTDLDFLAGHLFAELFERFGYPTRGALPAPVVASGVKFHDGPVDAGRRARHECEIALVSHHSQSPEDLLATLLAQAGPEARLRGVLEGLLPAVRRAVDDCARLAPHQALAREVRASLRAGLGEEPDARTMTGVLRHFALPLADRMFRHESVAWAAGVCERRRWRLRLYGRGWDTHAVFGGLAAGELEHGEELRASYRSARVHLHVSLGTLVHQRVLECALSGGFPLCRLHRDALAGFKARAQLACAALGPPHAVDEARGLVGWRVGDCAEAMAMTAQLQRLGDVVGAGTGHEGVPEEFCWVRRERLESLERLGRIIDGAHDAMWLLGDLAEMTFWSPGTLEAGAERAIERPEWRGSVVSGLRSRVRAELTHDAFLRRVLGMVRAELAGSAGAAGPARPTDLPPAIVSNAA